jgi:hypothetical protein
VEVIKTIHPDDHMWITSAGNYFVVGESGLMCVRRANELVFGSPVRRILDLPCGHGRVARYLRAFFPDASMSFCDVDRAGVDFCCQTFGGTPIYSQPELTEVDIGADHDVIWIGSLFTHVDRDRTERWLRYICSHLSERGVMVATFHGPSAIEVLDRYNLWGLTDEQRHRIMASYNASGYGYEPYLNFEGGDYGISITHPSEIVKIAETVPGRILLYSERLWADNHDVLAICRRDRLATWA